MEARLRAALWAAVLVRWATSVDVKLYSRWDRSRNVRERRESESRPRQRPSFRCCSIRTGTLPISQLVITAVVAVHAVGTSLPLYRWKESAKWRHVSAARLWMHVHKWVKSDQERARSTSHQNLIKLLSYFSLLFGCYDILFATSWLLYFCRWQAGCCRFFVPFEQEGKPWIAFSVFSYHKAPISQTFASPCCIDRPVLCNGHLWRDFKKKGPLSLSVVN